MNVVQALSTKRFIKLLTMLEVKTMLYGLVVQWLECLPVTQEVAGSSPVQTAIILYGSVAQSVEQRTENPCVGGSIPSRATIFLNGILANGGVAKWLNAADCKSAPIGFGSSNLPPSTTLI